jgi:hypothetical protein
LFGRGGSPHRVVDPHLPRPPGVEAFSFGVPRSGSLSAPLTSTLLVFFLGSAQGRDPRRHAALRAKRALGADPMREGGGTSLTFLCPRAEAHPLSTWGSLAWVPKRLRERGGRTNGHRNGHQLPWPEGDWQASSNTNQGESPNKSTLTTTRRDRTNQVPEGCRR